jgi:6-phosphogluconolactonase
MDANLVKEWLVYVGTYTTGKSEGLYVYRMDASTGELKYSSQVKGVDNPTFLTIDKQRQALYALYEIHEHEGGESGAVGAYSIDSATGELTLINQQSSVGTGPCHLILDKTEKFILVANYGGGSVSILPILGGGQLGEATEFIQHEGSSVNPERQMETHAHSIYVDRNNNFAITPDLGMDKVLVYNFDSTKGKLKLNEELCFSSKAGAGPRHFTFHPNGKYAYLINELDSTMVAFTYDESKGKLSEVQTLSTLPKDFNGTNHCADLHIDPSGKFLYGSNRGHDSLVIYEIDESTGRIKLVGHEPTQGKFPRNFAIDPTGNWLLAANQDTDTIVTFRRDQQTGRLTPAGHVADVPAPVCLELIPFAFV